MSQNPEEKYAVLLSDVNEQLSLILQRMRRSVELSGQLEKRLSGELDPDTIRENIAGEYLDRIERLELRVEKLEKKLKSLGIHPDEEIGYVEQLEIARKLERLPL